MDYVEFAKEARKSKQLVRAANILNLWCGVNYGARVNKFKALYDLLESDGRRTRVIEASLGDDRRAEDPINFAFTWDETEQGWHFWYVVSLHSRGTLKEDFKKLFRDMQDGLFI